MNGRIAWAWLSLPVLVICVVACAAQTKDESERQSQPAAVARDPSPEDTAELDPALAEIMEIRRELGDDPYQGTIFEDLSPAGANGSDDPTANAATDKEAVFSNALRAVAATSNDQPIARQPRPVPQLPLRTNRPQLELVGALRQAARALDHEAAQLEDSRDYKEADGLRRLASQLRRRARKFDGPSAQSARRTSREQQKRS